MPTLHINCLAREGGEASIDHIHQPVDLATEGGFCRSVMVNSALSMFARSYYPHCDGIAGGYGKPMCRVAGHGFSNGQGAVSKGPGQRTNNWRSGRIIADGFASPFDPIAEVTGKAVKKETIVKEHLRFWQSFRRSQTAQFNDFFAVSSHASRMDWKIPNNVPEKPIIAWRYVLDGPNGQPWVLIVGAALMPCIGAYARIPEFVGRSYLLDCSPVEGPPCK